MGVINRIKSLFNRPSLSSTVGIIDSSYPYDFSFNGVKTAGLMGQSYSITVDRESLIQRSETIYFLNIYAQTLLSRLITIEINTGLKVQPTPKADLLGKKREDLSSWVKQVGGIFALWSEQIETIDFEKQIDFGELQRKIRIESLVYGDCLVVNIPDANGYPQIKIINAKNIKDPPINISSYKTSSGKKIIDGVELDNKNRHLAYWVVDDEENYKRIAVRNRTTGRFQAKMVYCSDKRVGTRGYPILSSLLQDLHQLDQFKEATLLKKQIEASIVASIETKSELAASTGLALDRVTDLGTGKTEDYTKPFSAMEKGILLDKMAPDTTIKEFGQKEEDLSFQQFEEAIFNTLSAALNLGPETARIIFSSNYSASQAANVLVEHYVDEFKQNFSAQVLNNIYCDFVKVLAAKNLIPFSNEILDSLDSYFGFYAWSSCQWNKNKKAVAAIDKQVKALALAVENKFIPRSQVITELTGLSPEEAIELMELDDQRFSNVLNAEDQESKEDQEVDNENL